MAGGRPTDYNKKIADSICQWLACGKSLRAFCRQEKTPDVGTVCRWILKHDKFRQQYTQAREAAGYAHGDGVVEVVEMVRDGVVDPQTAKAMMDGLKWAAERMAPKAHGPKQELNLNNPDGSLSPTVIQLVAPSVNSKD